MKNLYIYNDTFTNGFESNLLSVIYLLSVICGIYVIISKNPILSILFLIALFLNIAIYLMIIGLSFIGLSYLLVYVGAVSILFLFILMLINVRISELVTDNNNSLILAAITAVFFNISLERLLPSNFNAIIYMNSFSLSDVYTGDMYYTYFKMVIYPFVYLFNYLYVGGNNTILLVTSKIWDGALAQSSHITTIGNVIYTVYPMWLLITSIILLLAMVGCISITLNKYKFEHTA